MSAQLDALNAAVSTLSTQVTALIAAIPVVTPPEDLSGVIAALTAVSATVSAEVAKLTAPPATPVV